jgi:hypothetical protein
MEGRRAEALEADPGKAYEALKARRSVVEHLLTRMRAAVAAGSLEEVDAISRRVVQERRAIDLTLLLDGPRALVDSCRE